ncbi:hypothetical protein RN01_07200 [Cupriavidus sp. SHE]|jgi:ProP effector|uniref:ProQ activator of osmoprotectant transporter prop n=1 Tax=Cupriavidus metallidurans TaxID=119219 RepID=A0A482IS63_9BURK|nr:MULTISPECIES: ProQ/FINO family protein [Cupriavidus]KWR84286.1 hypothetical protein RN01_07200 [Cupriavidus sp. SHE]QBP09969.1 ProQ activator of osmoprotectant transporter prop [Cupriavidus metallidurans]
MGFEQLAGLREQLRAQAQPKPQEAARPAAVRREPVDPTVEAIRRLQRHFPLAFPKSPAAKVPLKEGIFDDLAQRLDLLRLTNDELRQAVSTWCRGSRYWVCMLSGAQRVGLQGEPAGSVTADQARFARTCLARWKVERRNAKPAAAESA